ncbi:peptidase inhibitor family I36 protein [Nocardioides sp.]|uniref:peptidase inhibitor family I36 protein n=1 Tax=Nocardioides sp. TaxID=35761 RepID=UPI002C15B26A|nr:peptidase inhibitor family I36 protein [Nocardioides sp.]HSX67712.1 peptidase inhibitor family I36 protein [Nocardioides sp.]
MKKLVRSALAVVAVVSGTSVVAGAGAAEAITAQRLKFCANDNYGRYCESREYYDSSLKNDCFEWLPGQTARDARCEFLTYNIHSMNDEISSVKNNSAYWWKMFEHTNYGGYALCIRPWGYDTDLGNNTRMEDEISSMKRLGKTRPSGCDKVIG